MRPQKLLRVLFQPLAEPFAQLQTKKTLSYQRSILTKGSLVSIYQFFHLEASCPLRARTVDPKSDNHSAIISLSLLNPTWVSSFLFHTHNNLKVLYPSARGRLSTKLDHYTCEISDSYINPLLRRTRSIKPSDGTQISIYI
jgi:hypothetical protein